MATLRDIQRRIRSVQSTQKITRAMKLVAAAKLRRAQERILAARPYAAKMGELLSNLVTAAGGSDGAQHPLLEQREGPRRQIVIITADKGLAGAFNVNIVRRSLLVAARLREEGAGEVAFMPVGKKGLGTEGAGVLNVSHGVVVLAIVFGNVIYFAGRRRRRKEAA